MTPNEYHSKINFALNKAGDGLGWNARFLYWLDAFDLMLKPKDWKDPTGQNMDIQAPIYYPGEQVFWPVSVIGDKNEI